MLDGGGRFIVIGFVSNIFPLAAQFSPVSIALFLEKDLLYLNVVITHQGGGASSSDEGSEGWSQGSCLPAYIQKQWRIAMSEPQTQKQIIAWTCDYRKTSLGPLWKHRQPLGEPRHDPHTTPLWRPHSPRASRTHIPMGADGVGWLGKAQRRWRELGQGKT